MLRVRVAIGLLISMVAATWLAPFNAPEGYTAAAAIAAAAGVYARSVRPRLSIRWAIFSIAIALLWLSAAAVWAFATLPQGGAL